MNYRPIDIARKLNISTSTLRIYEDMGIIPPVKRSDSGYRMFEQIHLDYFICIRKMIKGYSLSFTGELLKEHMKGNSNKALWMITKSQTDLYNEKMRLERVALHLIDNLSDKSDNIEKHTNKLMTVNEISKITNLEKKAGSLAETLEGADVFIGVSAPKMVTKEMVESMAKDAVIFACANPVPEIYPDEAKEGGAKVVATGRSDFPNQINNVLAFPGIFRGAFDVRAKDINDEMKIAAANALAGLITDDELNPDYIIPKAFDKRVGPAVAKAVAEAARKTGVARL